MPSDATLGQYRDHLTHRCRRELDERLAGNVDVSGVVRTTMVAAYQPMATCESLYDDARTAWLRRVFANNLLDEIRPFREPSREVARDEFLEQAMEPSASSRNGWLVAQPSSPDQKAMHNEQAVRLAMALGCLNPSQRKAIELHHLKGMPLAEVGKRMKRDKGAVATLIFQGTKRLRELLGEIT